MLSTETMDSMEREKQLLEAAWHGHVERVKTLLHEGADAYARHQVFERTPLHLAAMRGHIGVVRLLLDHGVDAGVKDKDRRTPLHVASMYHCVDVVRMLLEHGVDPMSVDKNGWSPLAVLLAFDPSRSVRYRPVLRALDVMTAIITVARMLVEAGCEVGSVEEDALRQRSYEEIAPIRVCLQHWKNEKQEGRDLTEIPEEVFGRGAPSVSAYLAALTTSTNPVYRHKICVVGPTTWGKTSLIKSLTRSQSVLEAMDTRTVGIDLFAHAFKHVGATGENEQHEVTFWDFAGQEVYHSAHSVFFSRRALFLVVVDLDAYAAQLPDSNGRGVVADERMATFVEATIISWLRLIFSRVPDAKLAFVGTKKDRVVPAQVDEIVANLQIQAESWGVRVAASMPLHGKRFKAFNDLSTRIRQNIKVALDNWTVVTCVDVAAVDDLRQHLERLVVTQQSGFLMPDSYSSVLEEVRKYRGAAAVSLQDRVRYVFVIKNNFRKRLLKEIPSLCQHKSMVDVIMRTLHDLGDVIWYDDEDCSYPALAHQGVLAPEVVVDFIREVICHELLDLCAGSHTGTNDPTQERRRHAYAQIADHNECDTWMANLWNGGEIDDGLLRLLPCWSDVAAKDKVNESVEDDECAIRMARLRERGEVDDSLLRLLPCWMDIAAIDEEHQSVDSVTCLTSLLRGRPNRVFAIKSLLQDLGLAYPHGRKMHARSNLIIPAYWKLQAGRSIDSQVADHSNCSLQATASIVSPAIQHDEWEYEFGVFGVPSALFEHVVVRAFHPDVTQVVATSACVVSIVSGESALCMELALSRDRHVLRVRAVAVTRDLARQCVRFACTAIEKELMLYPGLQPYRLSLDSDGEMVELDEEYDEDNEDVQWLRERPWMATGALDKYPRAPPLLVPIDWWR